MVSFLSREKVSEKILKRENFYIGKKFYTGEFDKKLGKCASLGSVSVSVHLHGGGKVVGRPVVVVVVVVTRPGTASEGTIGHAPCLKVKSSTAMSPM